MPEKIKPNKSGTPCMWCGADLSVKWIEHGGGWACSQECSDELQAYHDAFSDLEPDQ